MRFGVFRALHRVTLGLMMLLVGVSNCFCESYDPDPYDDTPPVTVEFDYVLPPAVGIDRAKSTLAEAQVSADSLPRRISRLVTLFNFSSTPAAASCSPLIGPPLRR